MSQLGFNEPRKTGPGSDEREQDLDDSEELDIGGFGDDQFACECPNCGFRFND